MKMGIAFKKAVIKLVQDGLCQLTILLGGCHIIFISYLEYHFIESFFLFAITDFFVVVFDAAVFTFLLGVKFCQSCIEQLVIRILNRSVAILDVQMGSCFIYVFCEVGAAVMSNNASTGHSTNCSFYSCHLHNCGIFI